MCTALGQVLHVHCTFTGHGHTAEELILQKSSYCRGAHTCSTLRHIYRSWTYCRRAHTAEELILQRSPYLLYTETFQELPVLLSIEKQWMVQSY
jgi:hypothetical protein